MTDEKGETWSPSGMSKVRSSPKSLVADCSMHALQPPERCSRQREADEPTALVVSWCQLSRLMPPRVTLNFDLLTHKNDCFMLLPHGPLVPVGIKVGSFVLKVLCSQVCKQMNGQREHNASLAWWRHMTRQLAVNDSTAKRRAMVPNRETCSRPVVGHSSSMALHEICC